MITRRKFMQLLLGLMTIVPLPAFAAVRKPARSQLPRRSDVVVSIRKVDASADRALSGYRPTRLEWHYVTDPNFVQREKSRFGIPYASGTINANDGPDKNPALYARDFDGKELSAPWMEGWGVLWITVASSVSRARLFKNIDVALAAGCDGIQVDDGWFQLYSEPWGGDFSDESRAGFGPWLETNTTVAERGRIGLPREVRNLDYRDWLHTAGVRDTADYVAKRKSLPTTGLWRRYLAANVRTFWKELRAHLSDIPLSMNFGAALPNDSFMGMADFLDYTMCELPAGDEAYKYRLYGATAEAANLPFIGHFVGHPTPYGYRQQIAICYASGIVPAAPWDLFVPNLAGKVQPRIYADPERYADLYKFVREHASLFDDFGDGAQIGLAVSIENYYLGEHYMLPLAALLFESGVSYRLIPVGGSYREVRRDEMALAELKAIVLGHPRDIFSQAEFEMLSSTRLPLIETETATGMIVKNETIGRLERAQEWTLIQRFNKIANRSVFHVVPKRAGAKSATPVINLRFGTEPRIERTARIQVHRPGLPSVLLMPTGLDDEAMQFELPVVNDWAVIELLSA